MPSAVSKNPVVVVVSVGSIKVFRNKKFFLSPLVLLVVLVSYHIFMVVSINTVQNRYVIVRISFHERNDSTIENCLLFELYLCYLLLNLICVVLDCVLLQATS